MSKELENGNELMLDFNKLVKIAGCGVPVVPVGVQDSDTKELLIIAYANELALEHTIKTGNATFWSTSRNELWEKGATSGDVLKIVEIRVNCEQNSLLYIVHPERKGACHTKNEKGETRESCYYRKLILGKNQLLEFV